MYPASDSLGWDQGIWISQSSSSDWGSGKFGKHCSGHWLVQTVKLRKVSGIRISMSFPWGHRISFQGGRDAQHEQFLPYLDVINTLDIIFWLFWPFCTSAWEEVGRLHVCYPKWPKEAEHPETLVWEVPVILSKHCMPFLHQSSWGALAFWHLVSPEAGSCHHFDFSVGVGWGLCHRSQGQLQWKQWCLFYVAFVSNKVKVLAPAISSMLPIYKYFSSPGHLAGLPASRHWR